MAQKSDSALQTQNDTIQTETTANANTAARVGQMIEDVIDSKINNDKIVDEDNMVSNSATLVPSQQSVKAYVDAVAAADIAFTPAGTIAATNVQAAIEEVASEAGGGGAVSSVFTRTGAVTAATSDYDAAQIDNTPAGGIAATNVQDALNELDTEKAPLASPALTGVPTAPTAAEGTDTTQIATTEFVRANALLKGPSLIYQAGFSNQAMQQLVGPGANDKPIEIMNIGYTGHGPTDDIHLGNTGLVRLNGRLNLVRNAEWDQTLEKWLTPIQTASAHGSIILELGGEQLWLHASPPGVDFTDVPHEILGASANGLDGMAGLTTGYYVQTKAPIFGWYSSAAYNPAATNNVWNPSTPDEPMLRFGSNEIKGTVGTHAFNEFIKLEGHANSSNSAYGAINFEVSNGTHDAPTAITSGKATGAIAGKAHDGTTYQKTAEIMFVARGTISSGNAGQSIRFQTSATTTAGLATRMDISHDGAIKTYVPSRFDIAAITTIPDYTGNGYTPPLSSGTVAQVQPASTTNGGMIFQGFTVSGNAAASAMIYRGVQGHTAPTGANTQFVAMKHNGTTNFTAIANTEIGFHFKNNTTVLVEMLGNGNTGFGVTTPTALVHVAASSTARAGLCVVPGTAPTSPVNGDIWIDSTAHTLHVRINGVTKTVTLT